MSNILDLLAPPDRSRQALASSAAGRAPKDIPQLLGHQPSTGQPSRQGRSRGCRGPPL